MSGFVSMTSCSRQITWWTCKPQCCKNKVSFWRRIWATCSVHSLRVSAKLEHTHITTIGSTNMPHFPLTYAWNPPTFSLWRALTMWPDSNAWCVHSARMPESPSVDALVVVQFAIFGVYWAWSTCVFFQHVRASCAKLDLSGFFLLEFRGASMFSMFVLGELTHTGISMILVLESENSRRLWLFLGSLREFWRKVPGKFREDCWKIFPESPNATNTRISGTGKGKPAGNLGSTMPGPCPHLPCGVFSEIDSSSLLEFFLCLNRAFGWMRLCQFTGASWGQNKPKLSHFRPFVALDVLNRGLRFAAIRTATGSQRFQITRFESQGQKTFESLLMLYFFAFKIDFKSRDSIR